MNTEEVVEHLANKYGAKASAILGRDRGECVAMVRETVSNYVYDESSPHQELEADCDRCGERAPLRLVLFPEDGSRPARPTCYACWMSRDNGSIVMESQ